MSKGSGRRPSQVTMNEMDSNWDRIFGKKDIATPNEMDENIVDNKNCDNESKGLDPLSK